MFLDRAETEPHMDRGLVTLDPPCEVARAYQAHYNTGGAHKMGRGSVNAASPWSREAGVDSAADMDASDSEVDSVRA